MTKNKKFGRKGVRHSRNSLKKYIVKGNLLHKEGKLGEALLITQEALKKFPNNSILLKRAGALASLMGDLELAEKYTQESVTANPNDTTANYNLAYIFEKQEKLEEAKEQYKTVLKIDSKHIDSYNNLGILHRKTNNIDKAIECHQETLKINPNYLNAYVNLGFLYDDIGKTAKSKSCYQKALEIDPNNPVAHFNLGLLLVNMKNFNEAKQHYCDALKFNPSYTNAYNNIANLFREQKKFNKAKQYYQKALKINPSYIDSKWNLSLLELTLGNFKQGLDNYETRYHKDRKNKDTTPPTTTTPQYQNNNPNQDLAGKHILIIPEQGVGDEIMFASVLSELKPIVQQNPNTRITLACDPRLVELFNHSFDFLDAIPKDPDNRYQNLEIDINNNKDNNTSNKTNSETNDTNNKDNTPNHKADYWLFIGSLPKFYRNDIKDFDKHQPYLKANEQLLSKWQDRFKQLPHKLNIGISWAGGKKAEQKRDRSLTLEQMQPILEKASQKANLINLQYGDHQQEIQNFTAQTNITIHDWEDADPLKDLDNFTSQIKALDLVISIDNSTVHFAGALGTKTYLMLPFNQDWRWAEERADSYWYPNIMTLFRQSKDGQWDEVIQNVTNALE